MGDEVARESAAGWLARRALYPLLLVGGAVAVHALARALHPVWAMNLTNLGLGLALVGLERALPYRAAWSRSRGDVPTDLAYLALGGAVALAASPLIAAAAHAASWLAGAAGTELWPTRWPLVAQVPLALVVYEAGSYALHHLSHHTALWRVHAVHHSVRRLYWLNSVRSHPVDLFLAVATTSGPLLLLGASAELFAIVTVIGTVNMWLQHANLDLRTGWLDGVFVTPRAHRWHHSTVRGEQQSNLGAILLIWDLVFGTRLAPPDRLPPDEVGPGEPAGFPERFWPQLVAPFRRLS